MLPELGTDLKQVCLRTCYDAQLRSLKLNFNLSLSDTSSNTNRLILRLIFLIEAKELALLPFGEESYAFSVQPLSSWRIVIVFRPIL